MSSTVRPRWWSRDTVGTGDRVKRSACDDSDELNLGTEHDDLEAIKWRKVATISHLHDSWLVAEGRTGLKSDGNDMIGWFNWK